MYSNIHTNNPQGLKNAILQGIQQNTIRTWAVEPNLQNGILTHTAAQYIHNVLIELTPTTNSTILKAEIKWWLANGEPSDADKNVVIGNLTAMLLTHFPTRFTSIQTYP